MSRFLALLSLGCLFFCSACQTVPRSSNTVTVTMPLAAPSPSDSPTKAGLICSDWICVKPPVGWTAEPPDPEMKDPHIALVSAEKGTFVVIDYFRQFPPAETIGLYALFFLSPQGFACGQMSDSADGLSSSIACVHEKDGPKGVDMAGRITAVSSPYGGSVMIQSFWIKDLSAAMEADFQHIIDGLVFR